MLQVCVAPSSTGSDSAVDIISVVDPSGLPTIIFTHSAADLQWPELARLICPEDPDSRSNRTRAVIENSAIADWFFYHRVQKFIESFYVGVLGATDYWMRFKWRHRGSPHVHGLAWLPNAPDVEQLQSSPDVSGTVKEDIIRYADRIVSSKDYDMFSGEIQQLVHTKLVGCQ